MSDRDLTAALRALGAHLEETPELVTVVRERIEGVEIDLPTPSRSRTRHLIVVALALMLALAATALASSHSLRDWLLHRGVDARTVETLPATTTATLADLGRPVDSAAAARVLGQPLPQSRSLGAPDDIRRVPAATAVTLVWRSSAELPAGRSFPGVGALVTVWPTSASPEAFVIGKVLAGTNNVSFVRLPTGAEAVWIAGAPHAVRLFGGETVRFRMGANVLIWTADGQNYRLEATIPLDRALELAASFAPSR